MDSSTQHLLELGVHLVRIGDKVYRYASSPQAQKLFRDAWKYFGLGDKPSPLDWEIDCIKAYNHEDGILWFKDDADRLIFLPQKLIVDGRDFASERDIKIAANPAPFRSALHEKSALKYHELIAQKTGKTFFDGENARLIDTKNGVWEFQPCSYFDYLGTNIALDTPMKLRELDREKGSLKPLAQSAYANSTGINSLVFTADGYAVFMIRNDKVVVRPGEICSGYSGTIDWIDVRQAQNHAFTLADISIDREGFEEMAFRSHEVKSRRLLGVTRELIRGGTPEIFYALELAIPWSELEQRRPDTSHREGSFFAIRLSHLAKCSPTEIEGAAISNAFWPWMEQFKNEARTQLGKLGRKGAPIMISVPLWTNLALWLKYAKSPLAGTDKHYYMS